MWVVNCTIQVTNITFGFCKKTYLNSTLDGCLSSVSWALGLWGHVEGSWRQNTGGQGDRSRGQRALPPRHTPGPLFRNEINSTAPKPQPKHSRKARGPHVWTLLIRNKNDWHPSFITLWYFNKNFFLKCEKRLSTCMSCVQCLQWPGESNGFPGTRV